MNTTTDLSALVNGFVSELQAIFRRQAIDALNGQTAATKSKNGKGNGHNNGNGHSNGNGNGGGRSAKRTPEEMEAVAKQFLAFVTKHQGLRIEQIHKELGTNTKDLMLPIRKLLAEGAIKTKGQKRSTTYFAAK